MTSSLLVLFLLRSDGLPGAVANCPAGRCLRSPLLAVRWLAGFFVRQGEDMTRRDECRTVGMWIDAWPGSAFPLHPDDALRLRQMFAGGRLGLGDLVRAYGRAIGARRQRGNSTLQRCAAWIVAKGLEEGLLKEDPGPRGGRGWVLARDRRST